MILSHPLPNANIRAKVAEYLPWTKVSDWQTLFGGRTNMAWQVGDIGQRAAVLKAYRSGVENPLFPNDPQAEATMLRHLEGHNIAPDFVAQFSVEGMDCNLYHALAGHRWTSGVTEVAALMQKLHAVCPPTGLRHAANGTLELQSQAERILSAAGTSLTPPAGLADKPVPLSAKPVLLHCDVVPGNLIEGPNGLRLIDWQCPAIGDPTEDMAVFLSPAMQLLYRGTQLSSQEIAAFLGAFPVAQQERYRALAPAYHYRMAAYCLWQISRERQEYNDALEIELAAMNAA